MDGLEKPISVLSTDERRLLLKPSNGRGALAVLCTWSLIAAALALPAFYPHFLTITISLILLGGRHLALAILMHDAAHYSLFRTRQLNDLIGSWLCAFPTWQDLRRYRPHHMTHHKLAGSDEDPDMDLVLPFPTTTQSLGRKILRDLSGISGLKRIYGQLLMDLGFIKFTVSSRVEPIDQKGRPFRDVLNTAMRNLSGVIVTNSILFLTLCALGKPWLYLLWIGSYLTTFSLFLRIRSIAEHACTAKGLDPLKNTRTTQAHWLARLTVAPHHVNYHLEHHMLMTVPSFNLPRLHQMLKQRGALQGAHLSSSYLAVLRQAAGKLAKKDARADA